MIKVGSNKILVEEVVDKEPTAIQLPDNLKKCKYKIVSVGSKRTSFDEYPNLNNGDVVQIIPNSGHEVSVIGKKYKVINYDDVLIAEENV